MKMVSDSYKTSSKRIYIDMQNHMDPRSLVFTSFLQTSNFLQGPLCIQIMLSSTISRLLLHMLYACVHRAYSWDTHAYPLYAHTYSCPEMPRNADLGFLLFVCFI